MNLSELVDHSLHRPKRKMRQTYFPFRTSRRQKEILGTQSVPIFFLFGVTDKNTLDDGPHTLESIFIKLYSQVMSDDVILIVEDVQSWDWIVKMRFLNI